MEPVNTLSLRNALAGSALACLMLCDVGLKLVEMLSAAFDRTILLDDFVTSFLGRICLQDGDQSPGRRFFQRDGRLAPGRPRRPPGCRQVVVEHLADLRPRCLPAPAIAGHGRGRADAGQARPAAHS